MKGRSGHLRKSDDGFIVVAALWILGALAALASVYSIYMANAAESLALLDDDIRAEALISAAVELAAYQVTAAPEKQRPSKGQFAFRMNTANVTVVFCSEAARIDLNKASKPLLAGLFRVFGARPDDADQYADRIIGWRSAPPEGSQYGEESLYRATGLDYGPRGASFTHIGELALVVGIPPAMVERAMPFVTVYSGQPEIDVLDAAPEVLAALPDMTPERLGAALIDRDLLLKQPSSAGGESRPAEITSNGSKAIRVTVQMAFDSGRRTTSEAVIVVGSRTEPYRVLSLQRDQQWLPTRAAVAEGHR